MQQAQQMINGTYIISVNLALLSNQNYKNALKFFSKFIKKNVEKFSELLICVLMLKYLPQKRRNSC